MKREVAAEKAGNSAEQMSEDLTTPVDAHHGPSNETETTCRRVRRKAI